MKLPILVNVKIIIDNEIIDDYITDYNKICNLPSFPTGEEAKQVLESLRNGISISLDSASGNHLILIPIKPESN